MKLGFQAIMLVAVVSAAQVLRQRSRQRMAVPAFTIRRRPRSAIATSGARASGRPCS